MPASCPSCGGPTVVARRYLDPISLRGMVGSVVPLTVWKHLPGSLAATATFGKAARHLFRDRAWLRCEVCGLKSVSPMPDQADLDAFYRDAYWNVRSTIFDDRRPLDQMAWMQEGGLESVGSLLDFGAGQLAGALTFRRESFAKFVAVSDMSSLTQRRARHEGFQVDNNPGYYDLIYASHSLEHVADLRATINSFHRSRMIFIEVPNIATEDDFLGQQHTPHTFCFDERSLISAFSTFRCIRSEACDTWLRGLFRAK